MQNNYSKQNKLNSKQAAEYIFASRRFPVDAIKMGPNADLVSYADFMGKSLTEEGLTTSQVRNIFAEIHRIKENDDIPAFYMLKPKVAYIAGRHNKTGVWLFKYIFDEAWKWVEPANKIHINNFLNFMEAIVAYHKSYGGQD